MDNTVDLLGGFDDGGGVGGNGTASSPPMSSASAPTTGDTTADNADDQPPTESNKTAGVVNAAAEAATTGGDVDLLFGDVTTVTATATSTTDPDPIAAATAAGSSGEGIYVDDQEQQQTNTTTTATAPTMTTTTTDTSASGIESSNNFSSKPEFKSGADNDGRSDSFLEFAKPPPTPPEAATIMEEGDGMNTAAVGETSGGGEPTDLLQQSVEDANAKTESETAQRNLNTSVDLLDLGGGGGGSGDASSDDGTSSSPPSPDAAVVPSSPPAPQDTNTNSPTNNGEDLLLDTTPTTTAATTTDSDFLGLKPLAHRDSFAPVIETETTTATASDDFFNSFVSPLSTTATATTGTSVNDTSVNTEEQKQSEPEASRIADGKDSAPVDREAEMNDEKKEGSIDGPNKSQSQGETIFEIPPARPSPNNEVKEEKTKPTTESLNRVDTDTKTSTEPNTTTTTTTPPPKAPPENLSDAQRVAWLEKELQAAHTLIMQLQHHENLEEESPGDAVMVELQANLESEMKRRAEAENESRLVKTKAQKLEESLKNLQDESDSKLSMLAHDLEKLAGEKSSLQKEVESIREERDEQARKEMALTTRLNNAKKKEAVKANAAEHYEDQVDQLEKQVEDVKARLETVTKERTQLQKELGEWKKYAERRTKQLETELNDERKLNEERKRKMKSFVEAKTEEVRSAKADNISLQTELDQTSASLKEFNQRYKQLHAQWVQSQTRNRELQRDITKMKKDSEKMTKVGGTLEAKLSRSAQESEDHKNKRIQAKHELMSVLGQLETEKAINNRLREAIKMTFTPKALSQQQTIRETTEDLEGALIKLSNRLGRPLAPPPSRDNSLVESTIHSINDVDADGMDGLDGQGAPMSLSDVNTNRVLEKLDTETQRVSQSIVSLSSSVERMHALVDGAGPRSCVDAFQSILLSGGGGGGGTYSGNRNSSDERVAINRR